jgi:hypothetical protein
VSLIVKRLPDATWKGLVCQRVVVEKRFKPTEDEPTESNRSEWWVTAQGKWVKHIWTRKMKSFDADYNFDVPQVWSSEFAAQNFAPVFGPTTFKQPPPPKVEY